MFNCLDFSSVLKSQFTTKIIAVLAIITPAMGISQGKYEGLGRYDGAGRVATPNEVAAWDIDVRPDFKGLPKGMAAPNKVKKFGKRSARRAMAALARTTLFSRPWQATPQSKT